MRHTFSRTVFKDTVTTIFRYLKISKNDTYGNVFVIYAQKLSFAYACLTFSCSGNLSKLVLYCMRRALPKITRDWVLPNSTSAERTRIDRFLLGHIKQSLLGENVNLFSFRFVVSRNLSSCVNKTTVSGIPGGRCILFRAFIEQVFGRHQNAIDRRGQCHPPKDRAERKRSSTTATSGLNPLAWQP